MDTIKIKIFRNGFLWISENKKSAFCAMYDKITETYYFQDVDTGEIFDVVKIITDDCVIIS